MQEDSTRKRTHKQLLLAAVGVATVSFVGAQGGCAASTDEGNEDDAPYDDEEELADAPVGSSQQALTPNPDDIVMRDHNQNLVRIRWPIPVGNLMVTPIDRIDVTVQQHLADQVIVK